MKNVLLLNVSKPSTFSMELSLDGVDTANGVEVRFCFCVKEIMYCFSGKADKKDKNQYNFDIPVLLNIPKETYPFKIEVIADGLFLNALDGMVKVTGDPFAKATPTDKKEDKKEDKKNVKEELIAVATNLGSSAEKEDFVKNLLKNFDAKKVTAVVEDKKAIKQPEKKVELIEETAVVKVTTPVVDDKKEAKAKQILEALESNKTVNAPSIVAKKGKIVER